MFIVYQIKNLVKNLVTGKLYIGKTSKSLEARWKLHKHGFGNAPYLYRAVTKYGADNFEATVLVINIATEVEANRMERLLIAQHRSNDPQHGYNLTGGGEGSLGHYTSDETRHKMSEAHKGNQVWKGRRHSEESLKKMRIVHKGNQYAKGNRSTLGQHPSEETRRKLSLAYKGKGRLRQVKHGDTVLER